VTTHYMDEAERCARVGYLYLSKLLAVGTPLELKDLPGVTPAGTKRLEILSIDSAGVLKHVRSQPGVHYATVFGQAVYVLVDENRTLEELGLQGLEVHPSAATLEDVFVTLSRPEFIKQP
jgi:ABC-type multidrug transport system ATPase subunit